MGLGTFIVCEEMLGTWWVPRVDCGEANGDAEMRRCGDRGLLDIAKRGVRMACSLNSYWESEES